MKPRQIADLVGFVAYFYIVNRRLPERRVVSLALRGSDTAVPSPTPRHERGEREMTAVGAPRAKY